MMIAIIILASIISFMLGLVYGANLYQELILKNKLFSVKGKIYILKEVVQHEKD
jgi:uncharacterized membrane protein YdjX (TVP38/TMEM64 family)